MSNLGLFPTRADNIDPSVIALPARLSDMHDELGRQTALLDSIARNTAPGPVLEPEVDAEWWEVPNRSVTTASRLVDRTYRVRGIILCGATAGLYTFHINAATWFHVRLAVNGTWSAGYGDREEKILQRAVTVDVVGPDASVPNLTLIVIPEG